MSDVNAPLFGLPRTIGGYYVLAELGEGGVGRVYKAFDPDLDRTVAIKLLLDTADSNLARFQREARVTAQLDHPNITRIHSIGQDGEQRFIVMEYVNGRTLEEIVDAGKPLELRRCLEIARQVASALAAAASVGLVHRDVKPGNVMVTSDDGVKIVDFGLARHWRGSADPTITAVNQVIGTPDFLSPEQAQNLEVDFRSDMYSLGITLFFALSGRAPFQNDDPIATIVDQIRTPLPDVRRYRPEVSDEIGDLLDRLCRKKPAERFRDFDELQDRIRAILEDDMLTADPGRPLKVRRTAEESARAQLLRVRVLSLLLILSLLGLAYSSRRASAGQGADERSLLPPSVSSMSEVDAAGLPRGWQGQPRSLAATIVHDERSGRQLNFARLSLEPGQVSLFHDLALPRDVGGEILMFAFLYRLGDGADISASISAPGSAFPTVSVPLVSGLPSGPGWRSGSAVYTIPADAKSLRVRFGGSVRTPTILELDGASLTVIR